MQSNCSPNKSFFDSILKPSSVNKQVDLTAYYNLISKLMYLSCGTYSNIAFVVGQLICYNSDPYIIYLSIVKQVLQYLNNLITLGIKYENNLGDHKLRKRYREMGVVGYTDSNYASDLKPW